MLNSLISVVSSGDACADSEAVQLMLAEHILMLTECSKFSSRNVLSTYEARGSRYGHGDRGRGGYGGGGRRGGSSAILNGEWDKRGIANGDHDFAVHKLNNIEKCWYPNPEYQKMNPLEKRRLYLNQKKQEKSSDWSKRKTPPFVTAVYSFFLLVRPPRFQSLLIMGYRWT